MKLLRTALVRRHRLFLCLFLLMVMLAIQTIQSRITANPNETQSSVGIVHSDFDPAFNASGYEQIKAMVRDAVQKAGGLEQVITPGCSVVVKPNMVEATPPGFNLTNPNNGVDTNCWVTRAVVELAREAGAGSVVIAEGTAEDANGGTGDRFVTRKAFYNCGYDRNPQDMVDDVTGAPLVDLNDVGMTYPNYPYSNPTYDLNKVRKVTLTSGLVRSEYWLSKVLTDSAVLITVPTLKNHNGPGVTGALKNAIGHAPNDIYHDTGKVTLKARVAHTAPSGWSGDVNSLTIVDLNRCRKPDFVVIDGLVGIMNGPAGYGQPLSRPNPFVRCILAGKDPVAVDTVCSLVMGYDYNYVPYLTPAVTWGLGTRDLTRISVKGAHIASVRYDFSLPYGPNVRAERISPSMGPVYPSTGAQVSGRILVGTPTASDSNSGLLKAELYVDGQLVDTDISYPYEFTWDTSSVSDGTHNVRIYVYDRMMNETSSASSLQVDNSSALASIRQLNNGTPVSIGSVISTTSGNALGNKFYVEQTDRRAGICVVPTTAQTFAEGCMIQLSGTVTTLSSGEKAVSASTVRVLGVSSRLKPFGMSASALGGASSGTAPGPDNGRGAYNVGLLVSTWGKVTDNTGDGFFYVDDGKALLDGTGYKGVRIACGTLSKPQIGSLVSITGISSIESIDGKRVRCVRARTQSDIIIRE